MRLALRRSSLTLFTLLVLTAVTAASPLVTPAPTGEPAAAAACAGADIYDPMPEGLGHNHGTPGQHTFATPNLDYIGHVDPEPPADGFDAEPIIGKFTVDSLDHRAGGARFGELDVHGDRAYLASISRNTGVTIVDVSDPADPTILGSWKVGGGGYVTDVKASNDGRHFYASYQGSTSKNGIYLVDAKDPAAPKQVQFVPVKNSGVHMLWVHHDPLTGVEWLYGATAYGGGTTITLSVPLGGVLRYLVPLDPFLVSDAPHDVAVFHDTLTDKTLMVVANGGNGVVIADLEKPWEPQVLGRWQYEGAERFYAHTIRGGVVDGKRVIIVSPEAGALGYGVNRPARIWVLDATDLDNIRVHSTWTNPGNHNGGVFTLSTHNFQWVANKLYLAHYHGGVWVLDVDGLPGLTNPTALAYHLPHEYSNGGLVPDVWDVVVSKGYTMASDIRRGLYVYHLECDPTGEDGPTSYG